MAGVKPKPGKAFVYGFAGLIVAAFVVMTLVGVISVMLIFFSPFAFADSIDENEAANARCLRCHGQPDFNLIRRGKKIPLFVDTQEFKQSIHGTDACVSCHNELDGVPHKNVVYGKALSQQVNSRCQACHDDVAKIYQKSIHGERAQMGKETAFCNDCHGKHNIRKKEDPTSWSYRLNVPQTCTRCHQGNIRESYNYSFHGTSVKLGYEKGATCYDCHGAHEVTGPSDPKSLVNQANKPGTCARCHAKAEPNFANGKEHLVPQDKTNALPLHILWKVFIGLILFDAAMGGSIAIFELIRKLRNAGRAH